MASGATVGTGCAFRDELVRHGVLITGGRAGVWAYSADFEDTVQRVDRLVAQRGAADAPHVMRFPPLLDRSCLERSGYLESFPHLAGSVHSFTGDERAHRELLRAVEDGGNWAAHLPPTAGVLTPAACYPVYPLLSGTLPAGGRLVDVMSYCFRHEPSDDPARLQMFRMHEHVRVTDPTSAVTWRDGWIERAAAISAELGLGARADRGLRRVLRPHRHTARGKPARPAPQARIRHASRQRRSTDGYHLAQLSSGPLRRDFRDQDRRWQDCP